MSGCSLLLESWPLYAALADAAHGPPSLLTLQDVLHDRLQHHLLICVLHQDEPGKVFKDQLLEAWQLLPGKQVAKSQKLYRWSLPEGLGKAGTHRLAGGGQLLEQKGNGDLQQCLSEEPLAHRAAVVVVFLQGGCKRDPGSGAQLAGGSDQA